MVAATLSDPEHWINHVSHILALRPTFSDISPVLRPAATTMQTPPRTPDESPVQSGPGHPPGGEQRTPSEFSSDGLWGYTWTVLGRTRVVETGGDGTGYELHIYGEYESVIGGSIVRVGRRELMSVEGFRSV
jgi:hypothetical protein